MRGLINHPHPNPLTQGKGVTGTHKPRFALHPINPEGTVKTIPLSLHALTAAALILPGLLHSPAHAAEEDSVDFQYSHYQEGKRDIYGASSFSDLVTGANGINNITKEPYRSNPIEVDSLHGSGRFTLTDRVKFAFNYTQDTWSGATPVGTRPGACCCWG